LDPVPAKTKVFCIVAVFGMRELCDSGGPVLGLLDCVEDRRRGALD
jgi:hypothetical protein